MIVSQFQEVRRFMGRLDPGQDVAAGFRTVCRENSISSAWIMAATVLRNPTLVTLLPDGSGLGEPVVVEGSVFCSTMSGNVSIEGEALSVRLYATLVPMNGSAGTPHTGLVRSGEVVLCEFLLVALDDVALVRDLPQPGYAQWVQVHAGAEARARAATAARVVAPEPIPSRPPTPPSFAAMDEDESSELNILEMKEGDYVDHPKFGICRIVHAPMDERVSIRLPTGKHVDLHLGVMRVLPAKQQGGRRVFQIEVKRKTP